MKSGPQLVAKLARTRPKLAILYMLRLRSAILIDRKSLEANASFLPKPFGRGHLACVDEMLGVRGEGAQGECAIRKLKARASPTLTGWGSDAQVTERQELARINRSPTCNGGVCLQSAGTASCGLRDDGSARRRVAQESAAIRKLKARAESDPTLTGWGSDAASYCTSRVGAHRSEPLPVEVGLLTSPAGTDSSCRRDVGSARRRCARECANSEVEGAGGKRPHPTGWGSDAQVTERQELARIDRSYL